MDSRERGLTLQHLERSFEITRRRVDDDLRDFELFRLRDDRSRDLLTVFIIDVRYLLTVSLIYKQKRLSDAIPQPILRIG